MSQRSYITSSVGQKRSRVLPWVAPSISASKTEGWGWLPALSLVISLGLLMVAIAFTSSRAGVESAEGLFWAGMLVLVVPVAARLTSVSTSRQESIGLVVVLGLALYLVKVMHSPVAFTFSDELIHVYNVDEIIRNGVLFRENPILPATPLYPALATITASIVELSGLDPFVAGLVLIGVCKLILFLALYLLIELISDSPRVAGVATLIYMANSNFVFWSSQFAYESMALPLVMMVLFAAASRQDSRKTHGRVGFTLTVVLGTATVVVTHHMSSYFLAAVLSLWTVVHFGVHLLLVDGAMRFFRWSVGKLSRSRLIDAGEGAAGSEAQPESLWKTWRVNMRGVQSPAGLAVLSVVFVLTWLVYIANPTISYLSPVLTKAVLSIVNMIAGEEAARPLFQGSSSSGGGSVTPLWERMTGIGSVLLCLLGLPFGLVQVWRRYRDMPIALVLSVLGVAYFGMLGLRFTSAGWETSNRASAFLFLGLSFLLALGIVEFWMAQRAAWLRRMIFAACITVVFLGGIIAGWRPEIRLARPYLVDVDGLLIPPQGVAAATWASSHLEPRARMAADQSNARLMLAHAKMFSITGRRFGLQSMIEAKQIGRGEREILDVIDVRYIVVDRRRISWDNMLGMYFNHAQQLANQKSPFFDPAVSAKFDREKTVSRIFDSGNIVIYDVEALSDVASSK